MPVGELLMATATKQVKSHYTVELSLNPEEAHELAYYLSARPSEPHGTKRVQITDAIYRAVQGALR